MDDQPILRPLCGDDVAALADLWVRSWQETLPAIDFAARRGWITGFLEGPDADERQTIVVVAGGRAQGFVTIEPARAYLHQLAVAPAAKGQGLAVVLLDAAKAASPRGLTLDVNQVNTRAVRFYEREGFWRDRAGVNEGSGLATWRMTWSALV